MCHAARATPEGKQVERNVLEILRHAHGLTGRSSANENANKRRKLTPVETAEDVEELFDF